MTARVISRSVQEWIASIVSDHSCNNSFKKLKAHHQSYHSKYFKSKIRGLNT